MTDKPILSPDQGPKCKAIWRAKGYAHYDFDGRWVYEDDGEKCPRNGRNIFGFRVSGKVIDNA
ncbi:hypothetical protein P4573_19245 [Priestia megaterium]|uniref:hypothetical protein n=1 Tax=Priestia megaterium TaxID=1404 RepID=UPI002E2081C6|nr:hypothetical protein [Priestia megaterium]